MNTIQKTLIVRVLQRRTELVSAVMLWLPELLCIAVLLAVAGVFDLWWLVIPAAFIAVKTGLQVRAEQRQNRVAALAHLRAAARAAEHTEVDQAEQVDAPIVVDGVRFR